MQGMLILMSNMGEASSTILWRLRMFLTRSLSLFGSMEARDVPPLEEVPSLSWVPFIPKVMDVVSEQIQCLGIKHPTSSLWSPQLELVGHTQTQLQITILETRPQKFPSYRSRELFLTGESYAGHYIPQLANVLLDYNVHSTSFKFNIKGVAIGNPLLKLDRDAQATYEYFWSHGMISDEIGLAITNDCDFDDYVFASAHNMSKSCNEAINEANEIVGDYINNYDVIFDVCYPSIVEQELRLKKIATKISIGVDVCMTYERSFYFNLPEVQKALHANRTNLPYQWSMCSGVLNYSDTDPNIDILPILKKIVQNHIPVWVFSGDQDSVVPLLGSRTLIRELAHDLKFKITVPYGAWFHKGQVGGWVTEYGNLLTFATVRGAAHMVPYAQPSRALHLFSSFVHGRRLPNTTSPSIDD
uniref:Carboxypeptidase n=1 Tax=Glycine max TaxID=3847 RepID=K7KUN8_SOYBN